MKGEISMRLLKRIKQLVVRRPEVSDLPEFKRIASETGDGSLVDEFNTAAVVLKNDRILGFGVTRFISEAVFYATGSKKDRTLALKHLLDQAISDSKEIGANQLYVFVDSEFGEILKKHFKFKDAEGECLVIKFGVENGR